MQQLTDQERLKPWMSVVLFAVGVLYLITAGAYMQTKWGTAGLVLSELGFLALAVLFCVITRVKIKEVFPIKKITVRDFFGVVFMFIGGFLLNMTCMGISMTILSLLGKTEVFDEVAGLQEFLFGNQPMFFVIILTAAVMPAICEEAFMRGAILSGFRGLKKDWLIVLLVGLFFGILHLSPLRFLNTACLGAILAYIMVKKNNILLPMLLHFLNNVISSISGFFGSSQEADISSVLDTIDPVMLLGSFLIFTFIAPIMLVVGAILLDKGANKTKSIVIAAVISGAMLIGGIGISLFSAAGSMMNGSLLNWNYTFTVTEDTLSAKNLAEAGLEVEEERTYMVVVSSVATGAEISFTIQDENGEEVLSRSAKNMLVVSENIKLSPGHYDLFFEGGEDMVGKAFSYQVIVK